MSEFYQETTPTCHKPGLCIECGAPIVAGEQYHRGKGFQEDEWFSVAWCNDCHALRERMTEEGYNMEEVYFGDLVANYRSEYAHEFVGPLP